MELVTGVLGILLPKLAELLKEEYGLRTGVKLKIKSLSTELEMVQAVLREVGDVPWEQLDEPVKIWVCNLRETSYDMEDVVDSFLVRVDGTKSTDPRMLEHQRKKAGFRKKVGKLCKKIEGLWAGREISSQIQDITKKLEELAAMRSKYDLGHVANSTAAKTIDPRILNLHKMAKELVGIDGPRDDLIDKLSVMGDVDGSDEKTKVVSIVGFGGLGKTTLAKAVYDQLKPRFECTAFVPVGQKPDMKKVLRDILIDLDKEKYMKSDIMLLDEKQLIDELKKFVKEKRCFIVIDDMWDEESWKLIKCALQESNSSRVVITTRISKVARHAGEVYRIQPLSRENSEKLLHARIASGEVMNYFDGPSSEACDKILKKCAGVPLAIITIASLLASKPEQYWDNIYKSIGFGQGNNDEVDNTRRVLSFSYYDLPSYLKPCLLYLSVFPEDHEIDKDSLIRMWKAEGFIHEEQAAAGEGFFEVGEMYFNELINRNMIQPVESEYDGTVYACRVHDLVLDLINKLSREQNFITVLDGDERRSLLRSFIPRRLAMQHVAEDNGASELANINAEKVRSLIVSRGKLGSACTRILFLRVLHISGCDVAKDIEGMLKHLGSLHHLRYLRLPHITEELPRQIRYLKCLHTLDLYGCDMRELPEEVGLLTQLVCLRAYHWRPMRVPAGLIGRLTSLQQLSMRAADEMQFVKELGMLRELRVLWTGIYFMSESMERALIESLGNLHNIRRLYIAGDSSSNNNGGMMHAGIISSRHLQDLRLGCFVFSRVPAWLTPNLSYLYMEVQGVKEQDMEALARLPELCCLRLRVHSPDAELVSIKIPTGDGYFRKLRILGITSSSILFDLHASECSNSSRVASITMPSLESIEFDVHVRSLKDATRLGYDDKLLGFEKLGTASLQRVYVNVDCTGARISEVNEVGAALVHTCGVHPKHPTLQTNWQKETEMLSPYQEACVDMNIAKAWKLASIVDSGHIRALRIPDPAASSCKVMCLQYTDYGSSLLALSSTGVHKLWNWERSDRNRNPLGKATASVPPQLWQPKNGIVMTNDTSGNPEEATACYALSRNNYRLISASGGKIREFNMYSFEIEATIMEPPPAATFLTLYPKGYNIIAIGMDDSSIQIYDLQIHEVKKVLMGHMGKITGLTFSQSMDVLVSSGSDAQLCVWSIEGWEKKESRYIQHPSNCSGALVGDTMVQFHPDQTHILVVHESQLGIYNGTLECLRSWFPRDSLPAPVASAVHSANGLLVYAGFRDGAIGIFEVESLMLRCRIAPSAYIPSSVSSGDVIVYPMAVAANPWRTNQIAVGMSDGAVYVLEPLDTDINIGIGASGQRLPGDNSSGIDDSQPDA